MACCRGAVFTNLVIAGLLTVALGVFVDTQNEVNAGLGGTVHFTPGFLDTHKKTG